MERSILVEENNCKNNSDTVSKSKGSFIQIDTISIDLNVKDKSDAGKCEHFSIRGYVSEVRKKDWKICWPFTLDGDKTESEEQTSLLPPLNVPKSRWWCCQNCLQKVTAKGATKDYGTLSSCCSTRCRPNSTCSHAPSLGSAAVVLSGLQQAPKLVLDGRTVDANPSTNLSNKNNLLLCSGKKEGKTEVARSADIGHDIGLEDNVNQEMPKFTSVAPEVNLSMIQERHTNDTALKSKCNGTIKICESGCGNHEVNDTKLADGNLKCIVTDSTENFQIAKQTSTDDQHMELTKVGQMSGLGCMVDKAPNAVKSHTTGHPSLELECDYGASESAEIFVGKDLPDHHLDLDKSSGLHRRKTRKVRLLTELLGENGDAKSDQFETENSPSNETPDASTGLDMLSGSQGQVPIQGIVKRGSGLNRKRKFLQDEEWTPPEMSSPTTSNKKVQTLKGDAETTIAIIDNESEDAFAGKGLKPGMKSHWIKRTIDRSPIIGKKKNKKTQVFDACLSLVPPQENVQKEIQDKIGNASKSNAADIVSFRLEHDAFTAKGMVPSPLPAQITERKSSLFKKKSKNPQVDGGQASLFPWNNGMLRNDPFIWRDLDIMQTGPVTVPFQSAPDASTEKGLHVLSHEKEFVPRSEDGLPSLLPWQEGIPKVDQVMRKNVETSNVGDSSVPSKAASDALFRKGVNREISSKMPTFRMPFLNEMQNCTSQVEDGGNSQMQQMDYSGASNYKTIEAPEHSTVVKKHSDQKAKKVSEEGALDDITMEIVELMAKNQYERGLHDAQNNKHLLETTNNTRNAQMMDCTNVYGNGEFRLLHEETTHKQISQARYGRNGIITAGKNVGPTKRKSVDYFSHNDRNHLNVHHLDQTQTPMGFSTFPQSQKKPSSGVQFLGTDSSRHNSAQIFKWDGGMVGTVGHGSSHAGLQALGGCSSRQTVPQQSEETAHLWSTVIPNPVPFRYNIPQKGVAQSSNIDMFSHCPSSLHKGNMNGDHDLKFLNLNGTSLGKCNMNFGSETFSRTNAEYPLACKHNGIGLSQNVMGSLDLYSNETIPAMHLLSLMDAGMRSGTTFNMGGTPKRPPFPHDHNSKEFHRLPFDVYKTTDSIKHPPSDYYGKIHFPEKPHGCFHGTPTAGASASSSFQHDKGFERATSFTGQVALKSRKKDKTKSSNPPTENRGRKSKKSVYTTGGGLGTNHGAIPFHSMQKRFLDTSDSTVFTLESHRMDNSTRGKLEANGTNDTLWPPKNRSESQMCSVNKNPADFSMPGAGNKYMIRGEDLRFGKAIPFENRPGLYNLDGRKRPRNLKRTLVKERVHI